MAPRVIVINATAWVPLGRGIGILFDFLKTIL